MYFENKITHKNNDSYGILFKKPINSSLVKAKASGGWKKRYIIFSRGYMFYYKVEPGTKTIHRPLGVIDVARSSVYINEMNDCVIDLLPGGLNQDNPIINLKAGTNAAAQEWLEIFNLARNKELLKGASISNIAEKDQNSIENSKKEIETNRVKEIQDYYEGMIEQYKKVIQELKEVKDGNDLEQS